MLDIERLAKCIVDRMSRSLNVLLVSRQCVLEESQKDLMIKVWCQRLSMVAGLFGSGVTGLQIWFNSCKSWEKQQYHSILRRRVIPSYSCIIGKTITVAQDNNLKHSSKCCQNKLQLKKIKSWKLWLGCSALSHWANSRVRTEYPKRDCEGLKKDGEGLP